MACDRAGHDTGGGAGLSADHRKISFFRGAFGKLPRQGGMRRIVLGNKNATARVLVQTVHHARSHRVSAARKFAGMMKNRVDQCARPISCGGVDHQPGGFVEANEVIVLVENFQGNVLRLRGRARFVRRRFLRAYFVASAHRRGGARRRAVHANQTLGDGALPARAAHVRPIFRQPAIEPRSGFSGGLGSDFCAHLRNAGGYRVSAQGLPLRKLPR